jgi:hypothetical protein
MRRVVWRAGQRLDAGGQAQTETFDHRLICNEPGVLLIGHWRQCRVHCLVIAEGQFVAAGRVLEVVVNTVTPCICR